MLECEQLLQHFAVALQEKQTENIKKALWNEENRDNLKTIAWDLVPEVCNHLNEENRESNDFIDTCEELLVHLATTCNPKEVLLVLLEQADTFKDDVKFKVLLVAIQKCLLALKGKRHHSLLIALETLFAHMQMLPIPEQQNLEGKERELMDCDENVMRLNDVAEALLAFLEPFSKDYSWTTTTKSEKAPKKQREDLTLFLLRLLNHPLVHLDLSYAYDQGNSTEGDARLTKSQSRSCVERLAKQLVLLEPDMHACVNRLESFNQCIKNKVSRDKKTLDDRIEEQDEDVNYQEPVSELSLACLCFLIFGEQLIDNMPQVYEKLYLFQFYSSYVCLLLKKPGHNQLVLKGLSLAKGLLQNARPMSFPAMLLESSEVSEFLKSLITIMLHCHAKDLQQMAVKILPLFLVKLDMKGRNMLIRNLFNSFQEPGLRGYVIQLLKEELDKTLQDPVPNEYFVGVHLGELLRSVFSLPNGATTDLLEQSDHIMAALNLLRYLVLRDKKTQNVTGIWNQLDQIDKSYCELLRTAMNMSRAHYKMELQKLVEGKKKKSKTEPSMSLMVGGQSLPGLSKDQEREVYEMALHTLDMMESVLGRVTELIDTQK